MLVARDVSAVLDRLAAARAALAARSLDERVTLLGTTAELWLVERDRRAAAARAIAQSTGYAEPMIDLCLTRTFAAFRPAALRDALADVRPFLDGSVDRESRTGSVATPPALVLAILAQNTPGLAIAPVFTALAFGSPILVKSARGEASFARLLADSLAHVDPDLGRGCEAHLWQGGDAQIEEPILARADRVVVYGSAATIASLRARAGDRVVARGPRVSVAVVASFPPSAAIEDRTADSRGEENALRGLARRLARDLAFLDQRGCLSPQAILIDARLDAMRLGRALGGELASLEREWPRRRLTLAEAAEFRRAVDAAETALLAGATSALFGGGGEPWAVSVERSGALGPTPLDRFVRIHPFDGSEGLRAALAPLAGSLECVGLEAEPARRSELAATCRAASAARLCAIGAMQEPPAAWHAGGRRPFEDFLLWSAVDDPAPSPSAATRRDRFLRHVAQTSSTPRALDVASARGSFVFDHAGRAWLDLLAGIGVASIGHAHPEVARAVARQAARYTHVMVYGEDVLEPQVELAERLAGLLPPSLSTVYLTNSGAEAIEGALKLARKATGRSRVLSFEGAFHGDTTGALALGGNPLYRDPFRPLLPDAEQIPWNSVDALARIDRSVAAVFAEPVQAEAGVRLPSREFLPQLAARCREVGALLVLDEVVTGLGRTGRWFAFEHWPDSVPDVLVLAKALGGGLPIGAFITSPARMRVLAENPPLGHVTTFGGNPVSCAAALAALSVIERERLPERARRVGDELRARLAGFVGRGGLIEVRGLGLLVGLDFATPEECARFVEGCRARGVLLGWTLHADRVVRLAPPLNIADAEIDEALAAIAQALGGH